MRSSQTVNLPVATETYSGFDEQTFRRAVEIYLQELRNDVLSVSTTVDKDASLALRRHHFLLMGATNG